MKNEKKLYSLGLASVTVILFLSFFSSASSAAIAQSDSSLSSYAYITNYGSNNVSVINTSTNSVLTTVPVGNGPYGVAVTPDGTAVYVANQASNDVSIIDTAKNTVKSTQFLGIGPTGIAVTPDGTKVYVTLYGNNDKRGNEVAVIDTADTNNITHVTVRDS